MAKAPAKEKQIEAGKAVTVRGPQQARRRAGHVFGPDPVTFAPGELDEQTLQAILDDPLLTVQFADPAKPAA